MKQLANSPTSKVAVVKGQPGAGKTTLMKKIAYDWACNGHDDEEKLSLVLVIPLRYAKATEDLLQLATDYYATLLSLTVVEKTELLNWSKRLGRKVLICLDGLDEFTYLVQSPLKSIFALPFEQGTSSRSPPFSQPFQLLITSRPYACELIHPDFFPLRFEIGSLNEAELREFVRFYCETGAGIAKVTAYLDSNSDLVKKVPLILTFICYLADVREDIPNKLTLLYERLLCHMMKRELPANKLMEEIDIGRWKESAVVKSTSKLAFEGCKNRKFEFNSEEQKQYNVSNDSFICGFLLQKFDFHQEKLNADFPHRSIQEFFAALYCSHFISFADSMERNFVMKEILSRDSQFGRFFCGICSDEKKFEEMLQWLTPTFDDAEMYSFNLDSFLHVISSSLRDCSETEAEMLGHRLADSVRQLEKKIMTERNRKIILFGGNLSSLNMSFLSGLNLNFLDENKYSWSLSFVNKTKWSRLTYVHGAPTVDLREKFKKIMIFMWNTGMPDLAGMVPLLDLLPSVSTLIIQASGLVNFEINCELDYETITTINTTSQLRHFTFGFSKHYVMREFNDLLSGQQENDDLIIREITGRTGHSREVSWLKVSVTRSLDQSRLIGILIRRALYVTFAPENTRNVDGTVGRPRDFQIPRRDRFCLLL